MHEKTLAPSFLVSAAWTPRLRKMAGGPFCLLATLTNPQAHVCLVCWTVAGIWTSSTVCWAAAELLLALSLLSGPVMNYESASTSHCQDPGGQKGMMHSGICSDNTEVGKIKGKHHFFLLKAATVDSLMDFLSVLLHIQKQCANVHLLLKTNMVKFYYLLT